MISAGFFIVFLINFFVSESYRGVFLLPAIISLVRVSNFMTFLNFDTFKEYRENKNIDKLK